MTYRTLTATTLAVLLSASLLLSGCASQQYQSSKGQQYATTGAALGALVGALTAKNKLTGAALGAGAGLLLGYVIGNEMDKYDRRQVAQTLEYQPSGSTSTWTNPDTGNHYAATPSPAYVEDERIYRDVKINATIDGQPETVNARAYRTHDGSWQLVQ